MREIDADSSVAPIGRVVKVHEPVVDIVCEWLPPLHLTQPPKILLSLGLFRTELLDQYLLAVLQGLLYKSLAAENRQCLAHMEHALDRLDGKLANLALKRDALCQEKIIEAIEVMLAGARR